MPHALFGEGRAHADAAALARVSPDPADPLSIPELAADAGHRQGSRRAVAPQASMAFNFGSVAGALLFGALVDRFHFRWPLTLAYLALIVALLLLGAASSHAVVIASERRSRLLPAGRELRVVWRRACLLSAGDPRHGLGRQHRRRPRGFDRRTAAGGPADGRRNQRDGVVQYMMPVAAIAAMAVFALSFQSRMPPGEKGRPSVEERPVVQRPM